MKPSLVQEIEASEDAVSVFDRRPELRDAVREAFRSSEDYEVLERLCIFLSDTYRNREASKIESSIKKKTACLQFVPSIVCRYLSLLVSQTPEEEMLLSLIEAFLVVICTTSNRKLTKSVSMSELRDTEARDTLILVPSLLKASVYMNNNEVLFPKDFISYPSNRLEFLRIRTEPSISKLDASNRTLDKKRQDVLAFTIHQYNSCLSEVGNKSQKDFSQMCSCFALSGFDLTKTKFGSQRNLPALASKRFILSQFLVMELLQGLYQLSFYVSVREESLRAIEHLQFRAKHCLSPQLIMLTEAVTNAVDRSCLKQDSHNLILAEPEVSFQDRVGVVTSDSLRIAARRESIRLDRLENYTPSNASGSEEVTSQARRLGHVQERVPHSHHSTQWEQRLKTRQFSSRNSSNVQTTDCQSSPNHSHTKDSKMDHLSPTLQQAPYSLSLVGQSTSFTSLTDVPHSESPKHNSTEGHHTNGRGSPDRSENARMFQKNAAFNGSPHKLTGSSNRLPGQKSTLEHRAPIFKLGESEASSCSVDWEQSSGCNNGNITSSQRENNYSNENRESDSKLCESNAKHTQFISTSVSYSPKEDQQQKLKSARVKEEESSAAGDAHKGKSTKSASVPLAVVTEL